MSRRETTGIILIVNAEQQKMSYSCKKFGDKAGMHIGIVVRNGQTDPHFYEFIIIDIGP